MPARPPGRNSTAGGWRAADPSHQPRARQIYGQPDHLRRGAGQIALAWWCAAHPDGLPLSRGERPRGADQHISGLTDTRTTRPRLPPGKARHPTYVSQPACWRRRPFSPYCALTPPDAAPPGASQGGAAPPELRSEGRATRKGGAQTRPGGERQRERKGGALKAPRRRAGLAERPGGERPRERFRRWPRSSWPPSGWQG
jgi:hypothetical protein